MNNQEMTRRRPGDYVVNAELNPEQIHRFVADCENNGCRNRGDHIWWPITTWNLNVLDSTIVKQVENAVEGVAEEYLFNDNARNVTSEYKEQIMADDEPDLPPVGANEADFIPSAKISAAAADHPDSTWEVIAHYEDSAVVAIHEFGGEPQIVQLHPNGWRRRTKHKTPTEDDVGRLVMVRDHDAQDWLGPYVLKEVGLAGYRITQYMPYGQAKLYQGPTHPNWIEHDGRGVPDSLRDGDKILVQTRDGDIAAATLCKNIVDWVHKGDVADIMRYTTIEP